MTNMVMCAKLGEQAEALDAPPFPGPKGQQIFENISKQAWQEWLNMQTMLINEHKLASYEPQAKKFLEEERNKFLFGDDFQMPEGYVAPKS